MESLIILAGVIQSYVISQRQTSGKRVFKIQTIQQICANSISFNKGYFSLMGITNLYIGTISYENRETHAVRQDFFNKVNNIKGKRLTRGSHRQGHRFSRWNLFHDYTAHTSFLFVLYFPLWLVLLGSVHSWKNQEFFCTFCVVGGEGDKGSILSC